MEGVKSTVRDCRMINLPTILRKEGKMVVVEELKDIPFDIKRIYYIYGVGEEDARGHHAHKTLQQLIIAVSGNFQIELQDGDRSQSILLYKPSEGLLIVPGIWRDLLKFSDDAVCLVLASDLYNESDYIRNYSEFLKYKR
jgi:dTDP-4-dehydrorhamnose 3,5-epimerase-like enzyme